MEREIRESPAAIARLFSQGAGSLRCAAEGARRRGFASITLVARGSSDNAAQYGRYLLEILTGRPVCLAAPSLLTLYRSRPGLGDALILALSQSGEGPDVCRYVREARDRGAATVAFVNRVPSRLAREAEFVVPLRSGPERSVAATKTYTAELAALWAFARKMTASGGPDRSWKRVVAAVKRGLALTERPSEAPLLLAGSSSCAVVGRGLSYGLAQEASLKFMECARLMAHAYSTADFHHGPKALVTKGYPVVVLAPKGPTLDGSIRLLEELGAIGACRIVLSPSRRALRLAEAALPVPDASEDLAPLGMAPVVQTLALRTALCRGFDPDRPPTLSKVTRTL
jgi:glucosamine--fructose-6-phosphate aminotransferase (isomerizing)